MGVNSHQPIVNGEAVARVVRVDWEAADDDGLKSIAWTVVGRARVDWPAGGLANGLLLHASGPQTGGDAMWAVVLWERPREGGAGRFRLVPVGEWV